MSESTKHYKRDQIARAIAGIANRQREDGTPNPGLKADIKRLLDLDRELPLEPGSEANAVYAFYDSPPPGQGAEIPYSLYNAFSLLIGLRLLDSGLKQGAAVRFLRAIRRELEAEFGRILSLSPWHVRPGLKDDDLNNLLSGGLLAQRADLMSFLVAVAGDEADPIHVSVRAEDGLRTGNVCATIPTLLQRLEYFSHMGQAAVVLELLNAAHQLRYRLERIPVRKRGRS